MSAPQVVLVCVCRSDVGGEVSVPAGSPRVRSEVDSDPEDPGPQTCYAPDQISTGKPDPHCPIYTPHTRPHTHEITYN